MESVLYAAGLGTLLLVIPPPSPEPHPGRAGVVVESVEKGMPAETAGLRPGDVLFSWRSILDRQHGDVPRGGLLASPFDLALVEIAVAPRVPVVLSGARDGRPLEVRVVAGEWRVRSRPVLDDREGEAYASGEALARDGQLEVALAVWGDLAESAAGRDEWTLACWFTLRMAERAPAEPAGAAPDPFALAADTCAATGDPARAALAQQTLGRAWQAQQRHTEAEAAWREALRLWEGQAPQRLALAGAHHGLGLLFWERGLLGEAEAQFHEALEIRQALAPEGLEVAATLNQRGAIHTQTDFEGAAALLTRALEIQRRLTPEALLVAETLMNLATALRHLGRFDEAQDLTRQALDSASRVEPGGPMVGAIEIELGTAAWVRGDIATAEDHYRQALAVAERIAPDGKLVARCLNNLANVAKDRADWNAADEFYQRALALLRRHWPDSLLTAGVLANFGSGLVEQGRLAEADAIYREALAVGEKAGPRSGTFAFILLTVAELSQARGDQAAFAAQVDRAMQLVDDPVFISQGVIKPYGFKGEVSLAQGNLAEAEAWFRRAIALGERLQPDGESLALDHRRLAKLHLRQGRLSEAADDYRHAIDVLEARRFRLGGTGRGRLGFGVRHAHVYQEAIETLLEAGRRDEAFHCWERSRARALLEMLAERDLALDAELPPDLRRRRRALAAEYDRVEAAWAAADSGGKKQEQLLEDLRRLRVEQEHVVDEARRASPRMATLAYPQPLTLEQARRALDPGTALIAYSMGAQKTVLFVLAPGSPVEAGAEVEAVVIPLGSEALQPRIAAWRRLAERSAPPPQFFAEARALYDLLIRPVEGRLFSAQRLVLCPDGPLHQLPFAALRRDGAYLAEWKPLVLVPSATALEQLAGSRRAASPGASSLVAFGDPHAPGLPPLPGGRREVAAIAGLFPGARTYLGAEATEERMRGLGNTARYVHFAGHGVLNETLLLESALAFSPVQSATGRDAGLLHAWEIFEGVRLDADLVVLSACRSAGGKEVAGEGVLGLTRAFQYAGARSVVASLWRVPDKSTPLFMRRLYGALKQGVAKDEALRRAQVAAIRAGHHPIRWASFQLYGDWR